MFFYFLSIISLLLASGCVSRNQISEIELRGGDYSDYGTVAGLQAKGLQVGNDYLALADRIATRQDSVAILNIVLASGAALAVINGASDASILKAGVAGLAVNQTAGYFSPETARDALGRAARRQLCIVNLISAVQPPDSPQIRIMIVNGFTDVRFALRGELNRELNNYEDLLAKYKTASEAKRAEIGALGRTMSAEEIREFEQGIIACVART